MKAGNLVIGIDQTYERSIYEVIDLMDRRGVPYLVLLFRAYKGANRKPEEAFHYNLRFDPDLLIRPAENFRKATEQELADRRMSKSSKRHFKMMRRMLLDGVLSASDCKMIMGITFRKLNEEGTSQEIIPIMAPETPGFRRQQSLGLQ